MVLRLFLGHFEMLLETGVVPTDDFGSNAKFANSEVIDNIPSMMRLRDHRKLHH